MFMHLFMHAALNMQRNNQYINNMIMYMYLQKNGLWCLLQNPVKEVVNCTYGDIWLVGGSVPTAGRVEICINGSWGTICLSSYWDSRETAVICKQLGYHSLGIVCNILCSERYTVYIHVLAASCKGIVVKIYRACINVFSQVWVPTIYMVQAVVTYGWATSNVLVQKGTFLIAYTMVLVYLLVAMIVMLEWSAMLVSMFINTCEIYGNSEWVNLLFSPQGKIQTCMCYR